MKSASSRRFNSRVFACFCVLLGAANLPAQHSDRVDFRAGSRLASGGVSAQSAPSEADRAPACAEPLRPDPRVERAWLEEPTGIPGEPPPKPQLAQLGAFVPERAYHGTQADGTPWVRGASYGARFGADRASYTPLQSMRTPHSRPIGFSLAHVSVAGQRLTFDESASAQRDGDEIRYARGSLTERYDIGVRSIEQSFVFDELPARGEVVLRIAVETDLVGCETAEGIEFANERCIARYGRATALDATGASTAATTTWTGHEIEIRVPAEFVSTASLPLVVDPLISTLFVASTGEMDVPDAIDSHDEYDCAYDATFQRWLIVYSDVWPTGPNQIMGTTAWRLVGVLDGQTFASGQFGGIASMPRCANSNASNQFLVAGIENFRNIVARTISAADGAIGAALIIDDGTTFDFDLCVGGDPFPAEPSFFVVGWREFDSGELTYRTVGSGGTLGPKTVLAPVSGVDPRHAFAISKSNGGSYWNAAWAEGDGATHDRIVAARISWSGVATPSSTLQTLTGTGIKHIAVSPALDGSSTWALASARANGAYGDDVYVGLVNGTTLVDDENLSLLTELSGSGTRQGHQQFPSIDSDGRSFAVTYTDWMPGTPTNNNNGSGTAHIATVAAVGNQLLLSEALTVDFGDGYPLRIASTRGSGLAWRLQRVVYKSFQSGYPIKSALYDNALFTSFCHPGYDGVASCPCGNAPSQYGRGCNNPSNTGGAKLYATGISSVSSDSMGLVALNLPTNQTVFFYQGTAPLTTAPFSGQGLRCVGGTQVLLYTKPSFPLGTQGYSTAPNPGDPRIAARSAQLGFPILAGQTRYYYASYRTTGTSGGGSGFIACTNPNASNTTQSVQAVWIP